MSFLYHMIVSFFLALNSFIVAESAGIHRHNSDTVRPLFSTSRTEKMYDFPVDECANSQGNESVWRGSILTEEDFKEMELVFYSSPLEAQEIINHLEDPTYFPNNGDYRTALFVGEPGSGKTTMAKIIAYVMEQQGWEYKFLPSTFFLGEYRNQTAIRLRQELEKIEVSSKPTILIIDELNRLLENTNSKHHDTDATATTLWTFIDKQRGNEKFFFIGTMNRINKLPKPYKDRILFDYIYFPLLEDVDHKKRAFRQYLTNKFVRLDDEVTDEFLKDELQKVGSCAGRDLKKIASVACRINRMNDLEDTEVMVVKKDSIIKALQEYSKRRTEIEYDTEEETDEERQNRYHAENIKLQKQHFIQQQLMQVAINSHQENIIGGGGDYSKGSTISKQGQEVIQSLISDEQRKIHEEMMASTRAREARDAEIKAAQEAAAIQAAKKAAEEAEAARKAAGWFSSWWK